MFKDYIVGIVVGALLGASVMLFVYPRVTDQHTAYATFYVNKEGDIVKYVDVNGVTRFGDANTSTDGLTKMQDASNLYVEADQVHYTTLLHYRSDFRGHMVTGTVPAVFEGGADDMINAYNFVNFGMSSWPTRAKPIDLTKVIFIKIQEILDIRGLSATWTGEAVIHTDPEAAASYTAGGKAKNYNFLCRELPVTLDQSVSSLLDGTLRGMLLEGNISAWEATPEPCGFAGPPANNPPQEAATTPPQGDN
jgi:hypothetical protein